MTRSVKPVAKVSLRSPANIERSAEWLGRSRTILTLTGEQMAAAIGASVRQWWAWENGECMAPIAAYWAVRALLDARGVDSMGRIKTA